MTSMFSILPETVLLEIQVGCMNTKMLQPMQAELVHTHHDLCVMSQHIQGGM